MGYVTTTDELKEHLGAIQMHLDEKTILPFVEQAELQYIIPAVGPELYNNLLPKTGLNAKQTALRRHLQRAISYYALLEALPFMTVFIGDSGTGETAASSTSPVRQWTYQKLEDAAAQKADTFLDLALKFLEINAADFTVWKNSLSFLVSRELFISSTDQLNKIIPIGGSRRAFLLLRNYIERAELLYIRAWTGPALFDELKAAQLADSLSADQKTLLQKINRALGNYALFEALPEIAVTITGQGIRILSDHDGIRDRMAAKASDITVLRSSVEGAAKKFSTDFKQYLDENAKEKFPTYFNSKTYQDQIRQTKSYELPDNSFKKSFMV